MKRWRHFIVIILLIPFFLLYLWLSSYLIDYFTGQNQYLDWALYIVIGLAWIYPAIKVINWLAKHESF
jgi:cytochrome c oxidase subunit IV|tara:strand:+ start:377 stop:580 length:204 start_codon:yes stop_codon:yes gene_type:complete